VGGMAGSLAQMGMSITAGSVFMKYSRDAETEADMVGAQIIYDGGYDPQAVVSFFQKLKTQGGGSRGPQFLSSHPDPGNRARNVAGILARFPAKNYKTQDSTEYLAAKKSLADAAAGAPEQAAPQPVSAKRLPLADIAGQTFQNLQHVAYVIGYPTNWRVKGDAQSSVTFYPDGGLAGESIVYGAMVSGFQPKGPASKELDIALRELMTDIEQTNATLKVANSPQAITLKGRPARRLDWFGQSSVQENGQALRERVRLIALQNKANIVLYLVFVAPDADFQGLWPTFERMLNSLEVR
jgi:hypothetical protein